MILAEGQDLVLGGVTYPAVRFLGAGAIAEVYGSQLDGQAVAIKLLGSEPQSGVRFEPDSKEAAQLRHEADVLWQLNAAEVSTFASLNVAQERERSAYKADVSDVRRVLLARVELAYKTARDRVIVALLDRGQDDAGRPWLVEEMAPPAVEAKAVQGPTDELRMLEVMWRVAIGMALAHANQYALSPDFTLDTKADRIRVRWHGDTPEVRLIDWNITGGPDLFAKDLVYFGGHFYQLLLGRRLELNGDDRPLQAPGMGSSVWSILSEGTRGLLERLLHPDPRRRYGTAVELRDDLEWLVQVYKLAHPSVQSGKLRERAIATLTQRRYDRLAAVCDLALRGQLSEDDRRAFQTLQEEARRGLAQASPALSKIRISLGSGSYRYAALDAERELEYLDPRSEQARQLRYIRLLAQMGQAMREQGILDPGQTREWNALERGIQHLSNWAPVEAEEQFRLVASAQPALAREGPLQTLLNLARAYQSFAQANELVARTEPRPEDARRPDWLEVEKAQLDLLRQAVTLLEEARRLAPDEPYISDAWRFRREKLAQREAQFDLMERAEKALAREDYEGAEVALREVLAQNPQHARAQHLFAPAERRARFEALFKEAQLLINEGRYREAQAALTQAQARVPDDPRLHPALKQAEVGAAVQRRVELALNRCADLVRTDVRRARSEASEVASWPGRGLHALAARLRLDVALAEGEALPTFVLQPDLAQQLQQVQERIEATEIELVEAALRDAEELWRGTRFSEARDQLQQADLAHGGQIAAVKALYQRLEECLKVEKEMLEKVSAWSAQLAAQMDGSTVQSVTTSLSEYLTGIAANPNLPETVKTDARRLAEAVRSFFSQPDQSPDLRNMVQGTWAPHVQAVELMRELFAASLSIRAASARAAGRSEEVVVLLERKVSLKNLSLEEEAWKAEAEANIRRRKAVLDSQKKAREHLEAARTGITDGQREAADVQEKLQAALDALWADDTSEEANTIRREVASVWRQLARAQTDFKRAGSIARAGADTLRPFGLTAGLDADFVLLQRAIEINQQTSTYFEAAPEFWDTTAPEQLPQLGAGLRALQNPERSWPILQDWARQREQRVAERLAEQLERLIGQARAARQQSQFEDALRLTAEGQRLLPEGVWRDRGDLQEKWKALEAIREAVQPVLEARQGYEDVIKDLEKGLLQLGTPEAAQRIESLKAGPDDPELAGRLNRLKDLQEQARLAFAKPSPEKNHALTLSECLTALKAIFRTKTNLDDSLDRLAAQQEELLKRHISELVEDLAIALEREVQQLTEGVKSESTQLASFYWQARWIWSVLPEDVAASAQSLEKSLRTVDGLPGRLLSSKSELWNRVLIGDRSAAKQAEEWITNLLNWCRSLTQEPVSTDLPSSLPARREWSKTEGFTTDSALGALRQLGADLKLLNTPAPTVAKKREQLEALQGVLKFYRGVIGRVSAQ